MMTNDMPKEINVVRSAPYTKRAPLNVLSDSDARMNQTRYFRADIHESLQAQCEAMAEALSEVDEHFRQFGISKEPMHFVIRDKIEQALAQWKQFKENM